MKIKPISISLSPNVEKDDLFLAVRLFFSFLRKNYFSTKLEKEFSQYLKLKHSFSFNSGRSALMAILDSLELEKESIVLIQAFTCNAAVNPILWSGLKPGYVDCNKENFNIDIEDLKKKIDFYKSQNNPAKVLIVQHTFGLPVEMDEIVELCRKNELILIEDCAHALGAEYNNKKIGTFGKAAFFSFSRDKVISSVYGGMAVTNDDILAEKIKNYRKRIGYPSYFWEKQQLFHPILMSLIILPTYFVFGKYFLIILQSLKITSKAVHFKEKRGLKPGYFPKKLPGSLAALALNQFKKLEKLNCHRKKISDFYFKELGSLAAFELLPENNRKKSIFLRFPVKHKEAHRIIEKAWQKNLLIGDWYTKVIAPKDTRLEKLEYIEGSCPKAEQLASETFNLPTHINISEKQAGAIVDFIKSCEF